MPAEHHGAPAGLAGQRGDSGAPSPCPQRCCLACSAFCKSIMASRVVSVTGFARCVAFRPRARPIASCGRLGALRQHQMRLKPLRAADEIGLIEDIEPEASEPLPAWPLGR
jgi:hypothetical protein